MAQILLQNDSNQLDMEEYILFNILRQKSNLVHTYNRIGIDQLEACYKSKGLIPIGTIEFVTKYLANTEDFKTEVPIEIPKYLQTEEFLHRDYKIVTSDKVPRQGEFFLKDVSQLKCFGSLVDTLWLDIDRLFTPIDENKFSTELRLDSNHLYQVSSKLDIKSEYRVYVINNKISNIINYNGDVTLFPDISIINKANLLIEYNEKWLKSYTIDIAVGYFGTALLEIHNFTSVGLYSTLWGANLVDAYIDGIHYLLNDNSIKYL